jgi:hypothetical protein
MAIGSIAQHLEGQSTSVPNLAFARTNMLALSRSDLGDDVYQAGVFSEPSSVLGSFCSVKNHIIMVYRGPCLHFHLSVLLGP